MDPTEQLQRLADYIKAQIAEKTTQEQQLHGELSQLYTMRAIIERKP